MHDRVTMRVVAQGGSESGETEKLQLDLKAGWGYELNFEFALNPGFPEGSEATLTFTNGLSTYNGNVTTIRRTGTHPGTAFIQFSVASVPGGEGEITLELEVTAPGFPANEGGTIMMVTLVDS